MPDAVIFDLDGLLLDSEQVWSAAKQRLFRGRGGRWGDAAGGGGLGEPGGGGDAGHELARVVALHARGTGGTARGRPDRKRSGPDHARALRAGPASASRGGRRACAAGEGVAARDGVVVQP